MNASGKKSNAPTLKWNWSTAVVIVLVLLFTGYNYLVDSKQDTARNEQPATAEQTESQSESAPATGTTAESQTTPYLSDGPRGSKVSPAGLVYTSSRSGEHRTEHVLRHARDIPDRQGSHGVFLVDSDDEVFELIDEAYRLIKQNSERVEQEPSQGDGKTAYVIDMQRKIGFKGGQSGKRSGNPSLSKMKLILAEDRVVTAYPY